MVTLHSISIVQISTLIQRVTKLLGGGRGSSLFFGAQTETSRLLIYEPTYKHFPKKKDKSKMVRKNINLRTIIKEDQQLRQVAQDASSKYVVANPSILVPLVVGESQPCVIRRRGIIPPPDESSQGPTKKAKVVEEDVKVLEKPDEAEQSEEVSMALAPSFTCPNVYVINSADSIDDDLCLAVALLEGLCLPRDVKKLPTSPEENMAMICQLVE